ncbi:flagellar protein FlgN [Clostridium akagii]|uniref:flagellar protein FlgN n=1 Tax=Clostridium akagii TaxID=91623 RepID=UPI00047BB96B|nr:flagellar protein FlgN [Clostridium akagii]
MKNQLKEVMQKELDALEDLLKMLDEQHSAYIKKDLFALESIVKKIENSNTNVATMEVERRELIGNKSMKVLIKEINDEELNGNFIEIKNILTKIGFQKDTNELLIKQGLIFTNKMLNIFRPSKNAKTYNNYGKIQI